jgi:uncharacterized membrane protein
MTEPNISGLMFNPPIRRVLKSYPAWFAGGSLAASFFTPFIVIPMMKSANLAETVDLAAQLKSTVSAIGSIGSLIGAGFPGVNPAPVDHSAQFAAAILGAAPALYLIPLSAAATLIAIATGNESQRGAVAHGIVCTALTAIIFLAMSKIGSLAEGTLGFGFYLIAGCGVGQLLAAAKILRGDPLNLLRGPPAPPSAPAE